MTTILTGGKILRVEILEIQTIKDDGFSGIVVMSKGVKYRIASHHFSFFEPQPTTQNEKANHIACRSRFLRQSVFR